MFSSKTSAMSRGNEWGICFDQMYRLVNFDLYVFILKVFGMYMREIEHNLQPCNYIKKYIM